MISTIFALYGWGGVSKFSFFSIFFFQFFFNFLAELCHFKTFGEKNFFQKIFKKPFLAILAMKEASKRFSTFMQSCSASKILEKRWPKFAQNPRFLEFNSWRPHFWRYLKSETIIPQGFLTLNKFA